MMPKTKSKGRKSAISERRFGVLLENINSKFQQVLEGHAVLGKEIKDFRHETRADTGFLKFGQKVLSSEVGDIKTKLDRLDDKHDKNLNQVLEYLTRIDEEVQDLKKVLDKKAELKRLEQLEQKVAQIELVVKKWHELQ